MTPTRPARRPSSVHLAAEPLEARDAPATLVNPTTVVYSDVDGDTVTVRTTKGTFDLASNFLFHDTDPGPAVREQLQRLTVTDPEFEEASLTVAAVRSAQNGGDGFANVGHINANFRHMGTVSVDGDLGQIDAGNSAPGSVAIQSLVARSMGRFGTSTQAAGGNLGSDVSGSLGSLAVKGDVVGATVAVLADGAGIGRVRVSGSLLGTGPSQGLITADASIGSVLIGGDVRGGGGDFSGVIFADHLGPVTIGGSLIGGGAPSSGTIRSSTGDIGLVKVGGSLLGGADQFAGSVVALAGRIAGVTVAGSLVGGTGVDSASIFAVGALGRVRVGGDVRGSPVTRSAGIQSNASVASVTVGGSLIGGAQDAGIIRAGSTLGPVTISGSVRGGPGQDSGGILATTGMGLVRIVGDLLGGPGQGAGAILSFGNLAGVAIGGSVIGGTGPHTNGQIRAAGNLGPVAIAGDVRGLGADTGNIAVQGSIASITIGGSLVGGAANSGRIARTVGSGNVGPVTVKGNVIAGVGTNSGQILVSNGNVASVTIGGSLIGGLDFSGAVLVSGVTGGNLGPVKIGGDAVGGSGINSGSVLGNNIGAATVVGGLRGGGGPDSGEIRSQGSIGPVRIGRDVTGGTNTDTGRITATTGPITGVTVGGSLVGGSFNRTGEIFSGGNLGAVRIGGDIRGGSAFGLSSLDRSGYVQGKNINSVAIGGSVMSGLWDGPPGTLTKSGSVRADERLGPVSVKGGLVGNGGSSVIIAARGLSAGAGVLAIRSLTVGGRVEFAQVLGGYNSDLVGQNGNAQIGAVAVGQDWVASTIAAGVLPVNGVFGDADDAPLSPVDDGIVSRIASVAIKGAALGTVGGSDHYGFVAQNIGVVSVGGTAYPLKVGAGNDLAGLAVGATGDLRVREVAV
jgi:hypothetical protein